MINALIFENSIFKSPEGQITLNFMPKSIAIKFSEKVARRIVRKM